MDSATLTFASLNERIDQLPLHASLSLAPTRRQRWGYIFGFGSGFLGLALGKLMPPSHTTVMLVLGMLGIEVVGLAIALIPPRPWSLQGFHRERRDFAEQLDFDLGERDKLIASLSRYPKASLQAMAQYASERHERLKDKLPLLSGGLEKLGALPVLAALYLQFRNLRWPLQITWMELFLASTLVFCYWSSLLMINVRFRAQAFANLLSLAAERATEPDTESA